LPRTAEVKKLLGPAEVKKLTASAEVKKLLWPNFVGSSLRTEERAAEIGGYTLID
jgi:hypothetical protein